jgi:hypothetical protein
MVEASRYEDWEPPARRQLRPRKWTDHDWRMLAHYLRRVQKSQALSSGLTSREELDLMMVNVHAVVDRFVDEEAHGIRLEGEWARWVPNFITMFSQDTQLECRPEITGRAVYLIIKEQHKKDGTWKHTAFNDPSFSAILADMTRPRAPSEAPGQAEDLSEERVLPAALAELPRPSRVAASQLLAGLSQYDAEDDSAEDDVEGDAEDDVEEVAEGDPDEEVPESVVEQAQDAPSDESQDQSGEVAQDEPSDAERRNTERRHAEVVAARQRARELRQMRNRTNQTVSEQSSLQVDHTGPATPSTTFAKFIGSITSFIGNRSQAQPAESSRSFPKLKPVARNQVDLTHLDEDGLSFPILNHVPTPIRPTPARPRRQKHVEPKLDLPTLQHVSPPPAEPVRVPMKKPMRRVASVRDLARSFEEMEKENREAAEAARSRIGYGRSVSGPVGGKRVVSGGSSGAPGNSVARPATAGAILGRATKKRAPKGEIEVIEVSDSSINVRESVDM